MTVNNQFSIAVHLMAGLACVCKGETTSGDLANSVNACPSFVRRTMSKLAKAELVTTTRGKSGCCTLAKEPSKITLLDIYQAVDAPKVFSIHGYEEHRSCVVSHQIKPVLEQVLERSQRAMEQTLGKVTLAEVVRSIREG